MTNTKHDFECLIYICTCKKDEPMTTTKTYTYSFQVDPEIEMHLGSYLKQYEEIGFNKSLERIQELESKLAIAVEALASVNFQTGWLLMPSDLDQAKYWYNRALSFRHTSLNALKEIGEI